MAVSVPLEDPPQLRARKPVGALDSRPLRWVVLLLCLAALVTLQPFWVPVVLAVWMAVIARPLHGLVAKRIHRRRGAAALLTVLLAITFLAPLLIVTFSLSGAALELGQRLLSSKSGVLALVGTEAGLSGAAGCAIRVSLGGDGLAGGLTGATAGVAMVSEQPISPQAHSSERRIRLIRVSSAARGTASAGAAKARHMPGHGLVGTRSSGLLVACAQWRKVAVGQTRLHSDPALKAAVRCCQFKLACWLAARQPRPWIKIRAT